jgi:HEAT repeat protein
MTKQGPTRPTNNENRRAAAGRTVVGCAVALGFCLLAGCRTGADDVQRWANTQQGPRKIVAVMTHDKYPDPLRIEAALTLVKMKPRAGRRVGIDNLVSGLGELPPPTRERIVSGMLPTLEQAIRQPPPLPDAAGVRPADGTFPFKDAAFALLTSNGALVANEEQRKRLKAALADWAMTDFSARMDDSTQAYGMQQLLGELGPDGVRRMPDLIVPEEAKVGSIAGFIAELGDPETKLQASNRLVKVAQEVDSATWLERKAVDLKAANEASGLKVEGKRFETQLEQYQDEELMRVLLSLKKVGQEPSVAYLLAFAKDPKNKEARRAAALAALEGHVDRKNEAQVKTLLDLAGASDTPDAVRDLALRRVGELPRAQVIGKLYGLFTNDNWKIRWVAAELVLKMSEIKDLPEFMSNLSKARSMAITEPIRYGRMIGGLKGQPTASQVIEPYATTQYKAPVRLSALGYFLELGTKDQVPLVARYASDPMPVPGCAKDAKDCEWQCEVSADDKRVLKQIATVGEFVQFCVQPAMESRTSAPPVEVADAQP